MDDFENLANKFEKVASSFDEKILRNELSKMGLHILAYVKELTPVRTGLLRRSFYFYVNPNTNKMEIVIANPLKYAASVNYGKRLTKSGKTKGKTKGAYMLEKGIAAYRANQLETDILAMFDKLGEALC